jgi:hypothetical protein
MPATLSQPGGWQASVGREASFRCLLADVIPYAVERHPADGACYAEPFEDGNSGGHDSLSASLFSGKVPAFEQFHGDSLSAKENCERGSRNPSTYNENVCGHHSSILRVSRSETNFSTPKLNVRLTSHLTEASRRRRQRR